MELTKQTIAVLKNFSQIHNSIFIDEKNCIKTTNDSSSIVGIYDTEEKFEKKFGIYDLSEFLGVVGLFNSSIAIEFDENRLLLTDDTKKKVQYIYGDEDLIQNKCKASKSYKKFDKFNAEFEIKKDEIKSIISAARTMNLDGMKISIKKGKGHISVFNIEQITNNNYKLPIKGKGDCDINLRVENLDMILDDYLVKVNDEVLCKWVNKNMPLIYIIIKDENE